MKRAFIISNSTETADSCTLDKDEKFKRKCKFIERQLAEVIHINGALSRTIQSKEEKINNEKLERKFLLKKLLQYEGPETDAVSVKHETGNNHSKHKKSSANSDKTKPITTEKIKPESSNQPAKSSQSITCTTDSLVQPIPVNNSGHPIFPIELCDVSIYSIGDVVHDRPAYHNKEFIYPVGFCSTRDFTSLKDPSVQCLYTCKILDGGNYPLFEISPEDQPTAIFACHTVRDTFLALKTTFEKVHNNFSLSDFADNGHEFFGMTHPIVKNLIQSMPGSRKCTKYIWTKFDVVKPKNTQGTTNKTAKSGCSDINFEALEKWANDESSEKPI